MRNKTKNINAIIIGAGQAGLSLSYCLTRKGIEHLVLEKGKVVEEWRSRRWDSFRLITPNFMTCLPGFSYRGNNPQGFDTRDQMIKFFEEYAKSFNAPILENVKVNSVTKNRRGFLVKTNKGGFQSRNVAVAIGSFHKPFIPKLAKSLPENIFQIHSSEYKNSKQLPKGAVLVIGGGNSGIQIAVDLNQAGRKVYLSVGRLRIVPRIYRGKDFMEWAEILGVLDRITDGATEEIKNLTPPALFGNPTTVNLRKLVKDGIQILGRLTGLKDNKSTFANDLEKNLEKGEAALFAFKNAVDKFIEEKGLKAPKEKQEPEVKSNLKLRSQLDIKNSNITSIIWATGFVDDYSFLKLPVFDKNGEPVHKRGVSKIPGLYFIGLRWLSKYKSFLLCGVSEDAEYLASVISN